jgi:MinD superfamily P-loop ATPase
VIGVLERGSTPSGVEFARGVLNIGEPMTVPIIRELKDWATPQLSRIVIMDASPGTSCPVVEVLRGADFVLLVTEPTPFGLHDLKLAVEVVRELHIPAAVILNRCTSDSSDGHYSRIVEAYCQEQGIQILLCIPFEREIAEGIAQGKTLVDIHPEYQNHFLSVFSHILGQRSKVAQ